MKMALFLSFAFFLFLALINPSRLGHTLIEVSGFVPPARAAGSDVEEKDIQWFKEEMKISPQYVEQEDGILGISWAHFLSMVFLVAFGAGTLAVFILRYRRTKELIAIIKEEKEHGSKD